MTSEITNEAAVETFPVQTSDTDGQTTAKDTSSNVAEESYQSVVTSEKYRHEHEEYVAKLIEMGIRRYAEGGGVPPQPTASGDAPEADVPKAGHSAFLHMRRVKEGARETAGLYPEFDLRRELRDPLFLKLTVATGGDTTAAYIARHYNEIMDGRIRDAEKRGAAAVAASVKSGSVRPTEGALSKGGAVLVKRDPAKLSLGDFKRIRENFRKTGKRERF